MEQARQVTGGATELETTRAAQRLLIRLRQQRDAIAWLADHKPFLSEDEILAEARGLLGVRPPL